MQASTGSRSPTPAHIFWGSDSDEESLHSDPPGSSQHSHIPHLRPRLTLSSPRLFPRDFLTLPAPNASTRTQSFLRPQEYRDAANNLGRALENANRSLQDAQEAFHVAPQSALVDLTSSPPSQSPEIERAPQRLQSHERTRRVVSDPASNSHNNHRRLPAPFQQSLQSPNLHPSSESHVAVSRDFPIFGYNIQPDRPPAILQQSFHPRRRHLFHADSSISVDPFSFRPRPQTEQDLQTQDERAIQRQRDARALWDSNQRHRPQTRQSQSSEPDFSSPSPTPEQQEDSTMQRTDPPIESIDLTGVDDTTTLSAALSKQRQDAIASQKASTPDETGRTSLTSYKCPICMETPTDATSTICGHLFCHRCIIETLKWSQDQRQDDMPHGNAKAKGVCPVCRKPMDRKDVEGQRMRTLVPLNLMLGQQVKKRKRDKGKGVVRDGKENTPKKRETSAEMAEMWDLVNLE